MKLSFRFAAAAAVAGLAVAGAFYLTKPAQPAAGLASPTADRSSSPSQPASPSAFPAPTDLPARVPSWTATGSMETALSGASAVLLRDGSVLVAGIVAPFGVDERPHAELYDPTTRSWSLIGDGYSGGSLTRLLEGTVLAGTSDLFDPRAAAWTTTGKPVAVHQDEATITLLQDGRVLLAGGHDDRFEPKGVTGAAELFDPHTGVWTATGNMVTPRAAHTATLLANGKVLVAGGGDWEAVTASAELYDPASGTWTATGAMLTGLNPSHKATRLRDGRVLVLGFRVVPGPQPTGDNRCACKFVSVVELYDPASGTWTATGAMAVAREDFTATLLPDGRVLAAGGVGLVSGSYDDVDLASAEVYDPATGTWTDTATMAVARDRHTATLLTDGRVLVAGGSSPTFMFDPVISAELYDPGSP